MHWDTITTFSEFHVILGIALWSEDESEILQELSDPLEWHPDNIVGMNKRLAELQKICDTLNKQIKA